jgi:Holliday junction resolvase RusA-like endonuclease
MKRIEFTVYGTPQPGGSKRALPFRYPNGAIGARVTDANPEAASWKTCVMDAARQAYDGPIIDGPLIVTMVFYFLRPAGHYGQGRNTGQIKASSPVAPHRRPDVLKLARSTEDALTGQVWRDDAQTVELVLVKRYGEPVRAEICIEEYVEAEAEA